MTVVVKVGGHALDDLSPTSPIFTDLAEDVASLERVVIVHGGGPQIADLLSRVQLESRFHEGLRVTDDATMEVVSMALSHVNTLVVAGLVRAGHRAAGVNGVSGNLLSSVVESQSLGRLAGRIRVQADLLVSLLDAGWTPVVSPVTRGEDGGLLNCNADAAAGALARALNADALVLLSDIDHVRSDPDDPSSVLTTLTRRELTDLLDSGTARDGMRPKLNAALEALDAGARRVVLANGTRPHALRGVLNHTIPSTEVLP